MPHNVLPCRLTAHTCICVSGWSGSQCHIAGSACGRCGPADQDEEKEVGKARQSPDAENVNMQMASTRICIYAH